jgi:hypothetical protein
LPKSIDRLSGGVKACHAGSGTAQPGIFELRKIRGGINAIPGSDVYPDGE